MRAGKLFRRLQLQRRTSTVDGEGRPQEDWASIGNIWAQVQPLTSRELLMAAQAGVEVTHLVITRYRTDLVTPTAHNLRFVEASRMLDVVSEPVDIGERHRELQIECKELLLT